MNFFLSMNFSFCHYGTVLPFVFTKARISWYIHYISLYIMLFPSAQCFWDSHKIFAWIRNFTAEQYSKLYNNFFNHLPGNRYLGCLQLRSTIKKNITNMHVQISKYLYIFISFRYRPGVQLLGGMYCKYMFQFTRKWQILTKWLLHFTFPA
jgi:hypothetical protein